MNFKLTRTKKDPLGYGCVNTDILFLCIYPAKAMAIWHNFGAMYSFFDVNFFEFKNALKFNVDAGLIQPVGLRSVNFYKQYWEISFHGMWYLHTYFKTKYKKVCREIKTEVAYYLDHDKETNPLLIVHHGQEDADRYFLSDKHQFIYAREETKKLRDAGRRKRHTQAQDLRKAACRELTEQYKNEKMSDGHSLNF